MVPAILSVAPLDPAPWARARQYLYGGLAWGVLAQLWLLAVLAWAYYSGASAAWRRRCARSPTPPWWPRAGVALGLGLVALLALLPFDFYLDWVRERAFGFEHQTALAWLAQWGLSALLTLAALVLTVLAVYAALASPRLRGPWWLRLWGVLALGVVLAVAVQPVLVAPLFNRFVPLRDPALRAQIAALAQRAGIPHAQILEMNASRQSAHTNAFVFGLLGTQRIVVYDTLLRSQPPAGVAFVVAHEIGHYVLHHLAWGVIFTLGLLLVFAGLLRLLFPRLARPRASPADVAALPLLLFMLLALLFVAAPLTNGFSRWEEHQADAYGLRLSGQACAAVASFAREEQTDLIYPNPPAWVVAWFFTHPSQAQRIAFAQRWCRQ